MRMPLLPAAGLVLLIGVRAGAAEPLPFETRIETYRSKEGDVTAFVLRLEQPFLAEQFEKSNKLRLEPAGKQAYLIYPKETKFERKHAEFYGRLRGEDKAAVKLSYEVVTEDPAGKPRVDVRTAEIEIPIPAEPAGIDAIYKDWARQQNAHFAEMLRYYPETSFFEYVLLQSRDRYGVQPPAIARVASDDPATEVGLYHTFSGGLALQQSLQLEVLKGGQRGGDLNVHISNLQPPALKSLDYAALLEKKVKEGAQPHPHELAKLVPVDQYFLHFGSMNAANDLTDLSGEWGESVLRMFVVSARDHHLREKYEDQLCVRRDVLSKLFADQVISDFAVTGSDFFIAEGTDLTLLFRLKQPELFQKAAEGWLADVRAKRPDLIERDVNYRGHRIAARYTPDRMVSSFALTKGDVAVISNSPSVMRKIIDAQLGISPNLHAALDYRYVTAILPPHETPDSAYLYGSEAFLKHLVSPKFKIGEKRRLQAFGNLVMINNASMFYRLESGGSPESLSDLVKGNFYDPKKIVDPSGGAYSWDARHDTATSSVYNRIKYLTPIAELDVLQVSTAEQKEYQRYKERYEAFWRGFFDPIAVRMTLGKETVRVETLVLPHANGSLYSDLRRTLNARPEPLATTGIARSAVFSVALVPGRQTIGEIVRSVPGVPEVLKEDPTLTDLSWLGDRVSVHFLDDSTILEIDPARLQPVNAFGTVGVPQQLIVVGALAAMNLPMYAAIEVDDPDKATRLLEQLSSRIVLKGSAVFNLPTQFDAYRLPEYKNHKCYVLSFQLYAVKIRLHVALVGGQLVAATKLDALREAIDAAADAPQGKPVEAHAQVRINFRAMKKVRDDLQAYWNEKLRQAAHANVMPIYNLIKLYDAPIGEVNALADAKYGVTYFCPGGGEYRYDPATDQVYSTVFGNRQNARQPLTLPEGTAFADFIGGLEEMTASLRFTDEGLLGTVEIVRRKK